MFNDTEGTEPRWPEGEGKKLFVYIKPNSPAFRPLFAVLEKADFRTLWFAPGISPDLTARLTSPSLGIVREPIDISAVAKSAYAAILHGGHGTTAAMLLGGVPLLMLPEHIEQLLLARNVAALGAGTALNANSMTPELARTLEQPIRHARFRAAASAFAAKYKSLDQERREREIIARWSARHMEITDDRCLALPRNHCFPELVAEAVRPLMKTTAST
jgi:UDP:flavonoid glycosyltransferase YjiC (YdhE family)